MVFGEKPRPRLGGSAFEFRYVDLTRCCQVDSAIFRPLGLPSVVGCRARRRRRVKSSSMSGLEARGPLGSRAWCPSLSKERLAMEGAFFDLWAYIFVPSTCHPQASRKLQFNE